MKTSFSEFENGEESQQIFFLLNVAVYIVLAVYFDTTNFDI